MRAKRSGILVAAALGCVSLLAAAFVSPPNELRGGGAAAEESAADVHRAMERMNRAAEALLKSLDDPNGKNESLRLLGEMQRQCVAAKNDALPAKVLKNAKDEETKAKWSNLHRRQLLATLRLFIDAEIAVLDHEPKRAKQIMDEVQALRVEVHKELGVEDKPW